ncbi:MAG: 4-(cytidine 5'-diphospho)-2-C-methyl-D-erythritol kinase [Candidatus Midichloria sp.]|nr:MAG: 4-(cytidine 5'-diphospho)-2-C-methyl-D-erythritol kinase [Candidatus Midichloria sp.]
MQILQKLAYAKINLFLHIVGKRGDGYHLLESLFAKLKVHDTVTVQQYNELICNVLGYEINGINISMKAAEKLKNFANFSVCAKSVSLPTEEGVLSLSRIPNISTEVLDQRSNDKSTPTCNKVLGANITINKQIPIGAGLGGGSADAAAVLKLLVKLWNIKINKKDLNKIALDIGADVPFCLQNKTAFVTGIGQIINKLPELGHKLDMVLINPGYEILAKDAYQLVKKFSTPIDKHNICEMIFKGKNDLEEAALEICKDLTEVKVVLKQQKNARTVRMSGSGPTYFAIFDNFNSAKIAKSNIIKDHPRWLIWQDQVRI